MRGLKLDTKLRGSEMSEEPCIDNACGYCKFLEEEVRALKQQQDELLEVIGKMIGDLHERAYHELMTDPKHYIASALKQLIAKAKGEK